MFSFTPKNKKTFRYENLLFIVWVIFFACISSAFAKDLAQYKNNVTDIRKELEVILEADEVDQDSLDKVFSKIQTTLPDNEQIEFGSSSIDVNNTWLNLEISKYRQSDDKQEKQLRLNAIFERLEAIEIKLVELESAAEAASTKDEEKKKLAEILKREEYKKPAEDEQLSLWQRFLNWIDEWFKNNPPKPQSSQPQLPISNLGTVAYVLQILLYGLLAALLAFLAYKFIPFIVRRYRQREKNEKQEQIILGEKISANETSVSLFTEAEKLAGEGNLRDAIRKGYIAFLFELSERKLIGLAKHKTNRDYLRAVRKERELYKNMDGLTSNYERHWYGFENADEEDWQRFRENYDKALKQ